MQKNICCVFNVAPHYNEPIYKLLDKSFNCEFFLGDRIHLPIKLMEYNSLMGYKKTLRYIPIFSSFYWQKGINAIYSKSYDFYVMTGEPFCLSTWYVLIRNRFRKRKTFLWTHGWYGNESFMKKVIKKCFFRLADKVLLYGNYARNLMLQENFKSNKLITIYNSLDYENQLEIRKSLIKTNVFKDYFKNNDPVLIYIGRIQKVKKLDFLIKAINILREKEIYINLIVVGEDVEKTDLVKLVKDNSLTERVWFYGPCFKEETIGELIYNSDVCVSPGNVGLTAIHSLMYGTPVITHNEFTKQMPEFEAITKGVTGDFFNYNDLTSLVECIEKWVAKHPIKSEHLIYSCFSIIDEVYNPLKQIQIFKNIFNDEN